MDVLDFGLFACACLQLVARLKPNSLGCNIIVEQILGEVAQTMDKQHVGELANPIG